MLYCSTSTTHMYELVMSLKNNFSKNRKAMACARFLGVVKKLPDTAPEKPELDIGTLQVFLYTRRRIIYTPEQILASDGGGMDEGLAASIAVVVVLVFIVIRDWVRPFVIEPPGWGGCGVGGGSRGFPRKPFYYF